ncbi:MAG: SLBB domain-containing protein [Agarilytica sp.]
MHSQNTLLRFKFRKFTYVFAGLLALTLTNNINAQQPTQQQIEQFKRMSPGEQQALARSFGIDISSIAGGGGSSAQTVTSEAISSKRNPGSGSTNKFGNSDELEKIGSEGTDKLSLHEDEAPEATQEKLKLFGYDIFQYGPDAFAPAGDIPIPANYVLGPGDSLVIQLYGKDNATHALTLDREGNVQFPGIGPVSLAGLSYQDMQHKISEIVSQQMIGVKSSVTMGALRTIRIFVLGEAQVPGSYVIGSLSTMTNAIFTSGGITKIGSLRNVQLKRNGEVVTRLDLYDLLLNGDTSKDSRLLPGDVIFIPPIGKTVGVSGQVKRPAIYELKNEKSVEDAIELAGGLLPTAYVPASRIERITGAGEKTLVNLDVSTVRGRSFKIQDADVIQIFSTLDTMRDIVKLDGHVKRPGGFAWRENMRFTDIVPNADDLLPNPDIVVGLIQREEKVTRKIQVRIFSPRLAFADPAGSEDPKLMPRDTVTMFEYTSDRAAILQSLINKLKIQSSFDQRTQVVRVFGSVRFPGEYPLSSTGMKVKDLINLAGGLTESALGSGAEITRYDLSDDRQRIDLRIDLDLAIENPILKPGDTLRVKQIPQWTIRESVEITGEVNYPGVYDIIPGESLLDVIERAGGLTPHGYPEGAIFSREELRILELDRLENLKVQIEADIAAANIEQSQTSSGIDQAETSQILENIDKTQALGRMVIDLPAIIRKPRTYDFELTDGDRLEIPRFKPSVTVVGEIQHPTSHFFNDKLNVSDYIDMSGGTKQNADKKRIYVVKANGRVYSPSSSSWFRARSKSLEPGDTIIIPIDTDRVDSLTMWSSVTQIMYQAALGVAAISSL